MTLKTKVRAIVQEDIRGRCQFKFPSVWKVKPHVDQDENEYNSVYQLETLETP